MWYVNIDYFKTDVVDAMLTSIFYKIDVIFKKSMFPMFVSNINFLYGTIPSVHPKYSKTLCCPNFKTLEPLNHHHYATECDFINGKSHIPSYWVKLFTELHHRVWSSSMLDGLLGRGFATKMVQRCNFLCFLTFS